MGRKEENGKWVKHYSLNHQILLVGEGDFSFSFSLALSFGWACNIVASSLDSYDVVVKKYKKAKSNLEGLKTLGASVLHGVDATKMKFHPYLNMRKFDRVIFNFPHAGFYRREDNVLMIGMHKKLVSGFFRSASGMLQAEGQIHVSHKTSKPFCDWNIEELAWQSALTLFECVKFKKEDYPGYNNKRGDGIRCDYPFPLGECSTFKFRFSVTASKWSTLLNHTGLTHKRSQHFQNDAFKQCLHEPTLFDQGYHQTSVGLNTSGFLIPRCVQPSAIRINRDFFDRGSVHAFHNYGRGADAVKFSFFESRRHEHERHMIEARGSVHAFHNYGRGADAVNFSFFESRRHEHERHMIEARGLSQQVQGFPFKMNNQQLQIEPEKFPSKFFLNMDFSSYTNGTINHSTVMQNRAVNFFNSWVRDSQMHDFERCKMEVPGRNLRDGYVVRELRHLSHLHYVKEGDFG